MMLFKSHNFVINIMEENVEDMEIGETGEAWAAGKPGENVEQITKEPEAPLKIKDPKRIEAGKKLAAYNKKAKLMKKNTIQEKEEIDSSSSSWMPNINITLVIAILGLTFTACDLYFRYKESKMEKIIPPVMIRQIIKEEPERKFGMD